MTQAPQLEEWFKAKDIARAVGRDKKTVRREAHRQGWPTRMNGNREEYQVPPQIAELVIASPATVREEEVIKVRFSDLTHDPEQRLKVLRREKAVNLYFSNQHFGKEVALQVSAATMRADCPDFDCSARSLRRWIERYAQYGIDGLVEQKRGVVGVKAFAKDLSESELLNAAARAVGAGQWKANKTTKRLNRAEAFRQMVADPTIQGDARRWLHGARASKSSYPPSFGRAINQVISPLGATMLQVGKKAARLDGPFTNADYSDGCANHAVTADDMTANCYVWVEWPNERGFVLVRPQLLTVLHMGSLCWLNARAVVNARRVKEGGTTGTSTYDKDDVWALFGDTFDEYGLFADEYDQPDMIFVLEGGVWQSKNITGRKIMPNDDDRFGGLRGLGKGVEIVHTRTPWGKAVLEGAYHPFQARCDDVPGYCGRDEKKDCPEQTKVNKARVKAGEHPRSMFMHISEYNRHVQVQMQNMNNTRNDGKICQGMTPLEKLQSLQLRTVVFPDRLKFLYRGAYAISKIQRNGFKIEVQRAGVTTVHYYDNPILENYRGEKLLAYWNDSNPEADAVIYTIKHSKPDQLVCVAKRVTNLSRFGAQVDDMKAEATRKSLKISLASSQAKQLTPLLKRNVKLAELAPRAAAVGDQIAKASKEAETKTRHSKSVYDFQGDADALLETHSTEPRQAEPVSGEGDHALDRSLTSSDAGEATTLKQTGENTFTYYLEPSGTGKAQYVDYLLERLTEFRKAGASFGQHIGNVTIGITRKIAQSHLGCDIHDEAHFDDVCGYLKSKINATILGKRNAAKGTSNYHEFSEHALQ